MELPPGCSPATSTGWGTRGETVTAQGWVPRPCPLLTCPQAPHFGVTPGCWSTPSLDVPHFEGGWRDCATWGSCWRKWGVGGGGLCFTPHFHPISPNFPPHFYPILHLVPPAVPFAHPKPPTLLCGWASIVPSPSATTGAFPVPAQIQLVPKPSDIGHGRTMVASVLPPCAPPRRGMGWDNSGVVGMQQPRISLRWSSVTPDGPPKIGGGSSQCDSCSLGLGFAVAGDEWQVVRDG